MEGEGQPAAGARSGRCGCCAGRVASRRARTRRARAWPPVARADRAQIRSFTRTRERKRRMASAPIILVPGFWLGAWAWDEVAADAARRRPRRHGHDPARAWSRRTPTGPRSPSQDHVDAIIRRGRGRRPPGGPRRPQRGRVQRVRGERPGPGADRAMVYVDTAPGKPPLDAGLRGCREADGLGGDQGGGEPRRPERGAARPRSASGPFPCRARMLREAYAFTNDARKDIPLDGDRDRVLAPRTTRSTPASIRTGRSSPASPS